MSRKSRTIAPEQKTKIVLKAIYCTVSSPEYDEEIVPYIQELLAIEGKKKTLDLYPHFDYWLESHEDALRLLQKVNDERLGLNLMLFIGTVLLKVNKT